MKGPELERLLKERSVSFRFVDEIQKLGLTVLFPRIIEVRLDEDTKTSHSTGWYINGSELQLEFQCERDLRITVGPIRPFRTKSFVPRGPKSWKRLADHLETLAEAVVVLGGVPRTTSRRTFLQYLVRNEKWARKPDSEIASFAKCSLDMVTRARKSEECC